MEAPPLVVSRFITRKEVVTFTQPFFPFLSSQLDWFARRYVTTNQKSMITRWMNEQINIKHLRKWFRFCAYNMEKVWICECECEGKTPRITIWVVRPGQSIPIPFSSVIGNIRVRDKGVLALDVFVHIAFTHASPDFYAVLMESTSAISTKKDTYILGKVKF